LSTKLIEEGVEKKYPTQSVTLLEGDSY